MLLYALLGKYSSALNDGRLLRDQSLSAEKNSRQRHHGIGMITPSSSRPITPLHPPLPSIGTTTHTYSDSFTSDHDIPEVQSLHRSNLPSLGATPMTPTYENEASILPFRDEPLKPYLPSFRGESFRETVGTAMTGKNSAAPLPPVYGSPSRIENLGSLSSVTHFPSSPSNARSVTMLKQRSALNQSPTPFSNQMLDNPKLSSELDTPTPVDEFHRQSFLQRHSPREPFLEQELSMFKERYEPSPQVHLGSIRRPSREARDMGSAAALTNSAAVALSSREQRQQQETQQHQLLSLAVRLPDGAREELTLPASATLADLFERVRANGEEYGVRDMSGGPRAAASAPLLTLDTQGSRTLAQLGFRHRALLVFVPRENPEE